MTRILPVLVAVRSPVTSARVAWWTWSEARRLGGSFRRDGIRAVETIPRPPAAAGSHRPTVSAILELAGATCLVRAAILQRWDAAHDRQRPLVVGVRRGSEGDFAAHAWLDGDPGADGFVELHRFLHD